MQRYSFLQFQPTYNGTLFKWAYLIPSLKEDVVAFTVEQMDTDHISNQFIYNWLQHVNNIFCLGYDKQAHWHDRTALFKKNLLIEKKRRHLIVNAYQMLPATGIKGNVNSTKDLSFPDYQLCQYTCDQDKQCKGFTYINATFPQAVLWRCQFYNFIIPAKQSFCADCIGFIKT